MDSSAKYCMQQQRQVSFMAVEVMSSDLRITPHSSFKAVDLFLGLLSYSVMPVAKSVLMILSLISSLKYDPTEK